MSESGVDRAPAELRPLLPSWAHVSDARLAHIGRVVRLLEEWADASALDADETSAWRAAGLWHDALRDAPEGVLRDILGDRVTAAPLLHGPAAAHRLHLEGEGRRDVLDAIAHHTTGAVRWSRTGRALYMADFLEPGRMFEAADRAELARRVPREFDAVFREVVGRRIAWALREGKSPHAEALALWETLQ